MVEMAALKEQLTYAYQFPLYRKLWDAAQFCPNDIQDWNDWTHIPLLTRNDILTTIRDNPPYGGFWFDGPKRLHITPFPGLGTIPVLASMEDVQRSIARETEVFRRAGFTRDDVVQVTFGYAPFYTGMHFHLVAEAVGAVVVPAGPGNAEQQAHWIAELGVTALITNPSFALKIGPLLPNNHRVRLIYAGGEPLSAVEGFRERLRSAFGGPGVTIIDSYGISEVGMMATECQAERGLHVYSNAIVTEILDPETGKSVPQGQPGELVVTQVKQEGFPLVRFRTSDLTRLVSDNCACGETVTLPKGILGRIDEVRKVKGVKLYPSQIAVVLAEFPEVSPRNYRVRLWAEGGTDHMELTIQSSTSHINEERLKERMRSELLIAPNRVCVETLLADGMQIIDERGKGAF
ncbi:MAG: hypothetical protein C7B45_04665 [Sulfobacillus acidophilus]|uniref:AMP-dependent synthetase/ligase domain-containing protein n=1 Tax=Sulfobacillus acidophilus TaxID=53633 RepID=A0A2T2WL30_9FIRM|nr:MAG: hypothetical protein C7B45_04665 [Sulfobacillus acidophilus]